MRKTTLAWMTCLAACGLLVLAGLAACKKDKGDKPTCLVKVDAENNLLFLKGSVPGPNNGYVAVRRAKRG